MGTSFYYLAPKRKLSFLPISGSDKNFNPQNTQGIPAVKILIFLDLDKKILVFVKILFMCDF